MLHPVAYIHIYVLGASKFTLCTCMQQLSSAQLSSAHCYFIISQFIDKKQTMDIQRKRKEESLHFFQTTADIQRKKKEHAKKNVKNPPVLSSNIKMPAKKNVKTVVIDVSQEPSDDEEYPDLNPVCSKCGGCPCDWDQYGPNLREHGVALKLKEQGGDTPNQYIRFKLYARYTKIRYGPNLGRFRRMNLLCVEDGIKRIFPREEGDPSYVGFQHAVDAEDEEV
jgi:hypothetical protein